MAKKNHYLLTHNLSHKIYNRIEALPIVDVHNHIDAEQLTVPAKNIWDLMCAKDHYILELLNSFGVAQSFLLGRVSDREKFRIFSENFYKFSGLPSRDWFLLDLKNNFNIEIKTLDPSNEDHVWKKSLSILAGGHLTPAAIIRNSNIEIIGTTNEPWEDLRVHQQGIAGLSRNPLRPSFRADSLIKIWDPRWKKDRLPRLGLTKFPRFSAYLEAIRKRFSYFMNHRNLSVDIAIDEPEFSAVDFKTAEHIFKKCLEDSNLPKNERDNFYSYMICEVMSEWCYAAGIPLQLKIAALRDQRKMGVPDGSDISDHTITFRSLAFLANKYDPEQIRTPKSAIFISIKDPAGYPGQAELARIFPNIYYSGSWWTQDSPEGLETGLRLRTPIAGYYKGLHFYTDARSLTVFRSRFDMFKRVLANHLAEQIDKGRLTESLAFRIAEDLSYHEPKRLFKIS